MPTRRDITDGSGDNPGMTHIGDLTPDPRNARKHNPRNQGVVERSISQNGFGRSILLASDGTIIAGNATVDACAVAGLEDVLIVESDGTRVIAVKRTDVAPGSPAFHALALSDNRAAELADWDVAELASLAQDGAITPSDLWTDDEWAGLMDQAATEATGLDADEPDVCECCHQPIR